VLASIAVYPSGTVPERHRERGCRSLGFDVSSAERYSSKVFSTSSRKHLY
jgi:hypothetical protein